MRLPDAFRFKCLRLIAGALSVSPLNPQFHLMKIFALFTTCFAACLLSACYHPIVFNDDEEEPPTEEPGGGTTTGDTPDEIMIAQNDTAKFYVARNEITDVRLFDLPRPSVLLHGSRYRIPRKLEVVALLKNVSLPLNYWNSRQRILCYDAPEDRNHQLGSTQFGTGDYYTFVPHGNVTKAGRKTNYCILPIRSERIAEGSAVHITINDKWDN